jgi:Protein of unknown function (DUF3175)
VPQGDAAAVRDVDAELLYQPMGRNLPPERRKVLERAKGELRDLFGR